MEGWGDGKQPTSWLLTWLGLEVKCRAMQTIPEEEREWNRLARAENRKCPACGELIRFDEQKIFAERNLCTYCAEMIPKKEA